MGVRCVVYRATQEDIALLLEEPREIVGFLGGGRTVPKRSVGDWLRRRPVYQSRKDWPVPMDADFLELDKTWDVIRWLLRTIAGERFDLLTELGVPVGDVDVGYGPALAIRAEGVIELAKVMSPINESRLRDQWRPEQMVEEGVYHAEYLGDVDFEMREYVGAYWRELSELVSRCAQTKSGLVITLV